MWLGKITSCAEKSELVDCCSSHENVATGDRSRSRYRIGRYSSLRCHHRCYALCKEATTTQVHAFT